MVNSLNHADGVPASLSNEDLDRLVTPDRTATLVSPWSLVQSQPLLPSSTIIFSPILDIIANL